MKYVFAVALWRLPRDWHAIPMVKVTTQAKGFTPLCHHRVYQGLRLSGTPSISRNVFVLAASQNRLTHSIATVLNSLNVWQEASRVMARSRRKVTKIS